MAKVECIFDDIRAATDQQYATTVQINKTIAMLNDMSLQVTRATANQTDGVQQVAEAMMNVTDLMERNLSSSQRVTDTTATLSNRRIR